MARLITWYLVGDRVYAGGYPGPDAAGDAATDVVGLEQAGVTLFVDLTEEGELQPYAPHLVHARHARMPVPDLSTGTAADVTATLDLIDAELAADGVVYLHCRAGIGRTGTVAGCWLTRHALDGGDAVPRIAALRAGLAGGSSSPETPAQIALVRSWTVGA